MDLRDQTCCFTGHRILPANATTAILRKLNSILLPLIEQEIRVFWLGGALGFDTLAAEHLLKLKQQHSQLVICLALPFEEYRNRWSEAQKKRAANIDTQADQIVYCSHTPSKGAFLQRNRYMVDQSRYCIAYCNRSAGGTAYTLRYAQQKGLVIQNLFPL
ncbi:SLOG family protein [Candidatus Agathobaculum pullicola]|uniref:SLOG family protein n=1 Tax=Candidatus Agathobaculum pullicola TaxID=2838426 RepID=UPI003F927D86